MNDARLRFTMKATVISGDAPPSPSTDQLPSGWVRLPVSFQVTLPAELTEGAGQGGSSAGSGGDPAPVSLMPRSPQPGTGSRPDGGRTRQDLDAPVGQSRNDPSAPHAPQGSRDDGRTIGAATLNSLGLGAAFGRKPGNRPVDPLGANSVEAPRPPATGHPDGTARGGSQPAASIGQGIGQVTGKPPGATGNRALNAVFKAGQIGT